MVKEGKLPFRYDKAKARLHTWRNRSSRSKHGRFTGGVWAACGTRTDGASAIWSSFDFPQGSRFGLIKRGEADKEPVRWFDAKGGCIFHTVGAWEEVRGSSPDNTTPVDDGPPRNGPCLSPLR